MVRRFEVYYSGRVQGVGFRYAALRVAGGYDVSGFVRNLEDRRVELVVEGRREEVQAFLKDLGERMAGNIRNTVVQELDPSGRFQGFEIRHR